MSGKAQRRRQQEKGQFWTPDWVAEAMVTWLLEDGGGPLFDPAVGNGAFFRAARRVARERQQTVLMQGMEIDPEVLMSGLDEEDRKFIRQGDFLLDPPPEALAAVVANPPYIRHHRIPETTKSRLRAKVRELTGLALDGRAGLHVYFFIRALTGLAPGGRLVFLLSADVCEGRFAASLWRWVAQHFRIAAVVTFAPEASPFPGVDVNPLLVFIQREAPAARLIWAVCRQAGTDGLRQWVASGFPPSGRQGTEEMPAGMTGWERDLSEALETGLSRPPALVRGGWIGPVLEHVAQVRRGVATGANGFFLLTDSQVKAFGIPEPYLKLAVGRVRDVPGDELTAEVMDWLRQRGRPAWLLSLGMEPVERYPEGLQQYLRLGEAAGLPRRPLLSCRRPWYRMEQREAPPVLFAYLGRRRSRFIRNRARVIPLTGFLGVYPRPGVDVEKLWQVLNHPETLAGLKWVGKSYGGGAIKVEPRALERLPLPWSALKAAGLTEGGGVNGEQQVANGE